MRHYCTYCDNNYLPRALVTYASLRCHSKEPLTLWVLCLNDSAYNTLVAIDLPGIRPVSLTTLEAADPDLAAIKGSRAVIEYYFTLSPIWPLYLLNLYPEIDVVTYIDSDLAFYSDPQPIYNELADGSVLIIPHRFPDDQAALNIYGRYNVGLLCFRNDDNGRACLSWWRERCLEWCKDELDEIHGRYADQRYLDRFPDLFAGVVALEHVGANLAPWNFRRFAIQRATNGQITVDDQPLIFYHFQGVRLLTNWMYNTNLDRYGIMPQQVFRWLYPGYVGQLLAVRQWMYTYYPESELSHQHMRRGRPSLVAFIKGVFKRAVVVHRHQTVKLAKNWLGQPS